MGYLVIIFIKLCWLYGVSWYSIHLYYSLPLAGPWGHTWCSDRADVSIFYQHVRFEVGYNFIKAWTIIKIIMKMMNADYIYTYIYVCVCVCIYLGSISSLMHISLNNIDIFYSIWWKLVDETPITNCYPNTFCPILGDHQGCVYCKRDVTFAGTLLLFKCLLFILVCCCSVLFMSISSSSS